MRGFQLPKGHRFDIRVQPVSKTVRGYKHISEEYAADFETGKAIQVATYSYYRAGEGDRVDPLEGRVEKRIDNLMVWDEGITSEQINKIKDFGVDLPAGGTNIFMFDMKAHEELPEEYLFCCSSEPDFSRLEKSEAIFEISDLRKFARAMHNARPDLFRNARAGFVEYVPRSADVFADPEISPDPLKKSERFAFEKEIRVIWQPLKMGAERELISGVDVAGLIKRVRPG